MRSLLNTFTNEEDSVSSSAEVLEVGKHFDCSDSLFASAFGCPQMKWSPLIVAGRLRAGCGFILSTPLYCSLVPSPTLAAFFLQPRKKTWTFFHGCENSCEGRPGYEANCIVHNSYIEHVLMAAVVIEHPWVVIIDEEQALQDPSLVPRPHTPTKHCWGVNATT